MLKKLPDAAGDLSERLGLPEDLLFASAKLTVIAGKRIMVENHRGILEYSPEHILLAVGRGKISLSGSDFVIDAMNKNEIIISGRLQCVDWE